MADAYQQARVLEQAQKQSSSYDSYSIATIEATLSYDYVAATTSKNPSNGSKCYFCGNQKHVRHPCPTKDSVCYKCKTKGHWARVCRGKRLAGIASLDNNFPSLPCLGGADIANVSCKINNSSLKAMIDSGSCSTFINKNAAEKLKLIVSLRSKSVSLAYPTCKAQVIGEVVDDLNLDSHLYSGVVMEVLDCLFINVIIWKDIFEKHKKVTPKFYGSKDELIVGAVRSSETFPAMRIAPLPLFTNVNSGIKPIATKSWRYLPAGFICKEVARILGRELLNHLFSHGKLSSWLSRVRITRNVW